LEVIILILQCQIILKCHKLRKLLAGAKILKLETIVYIVFRVCRFLCFHNSLCIGSGFTSEIVVIRIFKQLTMDEN
jgi:hypothetical protein